MVAKFGFVFGVIVATLGAVSAVTDDEIKAIRSAVMPILDACGQEYGVTKEQVKAARQAANFDSIDSCFLACFFKAPGAINSSGMFDKDTAVEKNKKYIKGEDDIKNIVGISETCSSVNDEAVSDGDKGCDRAKLLMACFLKEQAKFVPFMSSI